MTPIIRVLGAWALGVFLAGTACSASRPQSVVPATVHLSSAEIAPPSRSDSAELPADLALTVRTVNPISTETSSEASKFIAVLAGPIHASDGSEIFPAGATVYGQVVESRPRGPIRLPRITLTLGAIQGPKGTARLATDIIGVEADGAGALKKIGAGALVGPAAADGDGSSEPAVLFGGGKGILLQPGTLIEFHLTQPAHLE